MPWRPTYWQHILHQKHLKDDQRSFNLKELKQTYQLTNSQRDRERDRERDSKLQLPEARNPSSSRETERGVIAEIFAVLPQKRNHKKKPNRTKTGHPQKETETHLTTADTVTTTWNQSPTSPKFTNTSRMVIWRSPPNPLAPPAQRQDLPDFSTISSPPAPARQWMVTEFCEVLQDLLLLQQPK